MPAGANNVYPYTICCGTFDATSGVMVVGGVYGIPAANITRTSKGLYSVVIPGNSATAEIQLKMGTNGANEAVATSSYTAATGTWVLAATDLANALSEASVWFEVVCLGGT